MVIGATALPPALGSCPLLPASTVWPPDQIFGTSHSLTSPPGVLASATPMIHLPRWVLATLKKWIPKVRNPNFLSARLNQVSLGSCMHCWDISELFCFFTFLFWALLYHYNSLLSSSVLLLFSFASNEQPFLETRLCFWMSSWVSIFTYTTKVSSGQGSKWVSSLCSNQSSRNWCYQSNAFPLQVE